MSAALVHVVAVTKNGVIGRAGGLPWRLSSDLKRFRALTMGKPMIMGRKTFDSIGKALDGRDSIVLTRDASFAATGAIVRGSIDAALEEARARALQRGVDEIAIIGGGEIFAATLPLTQRIYLTRVMSDMDGDTVYPALDEQDWHVVSREVVPRGDKDDHETAFMVMERL